jgi:ABC-type bacteriocin/lantibiotic exporter with double-glycine peptidase domain
MPKSFWQRMVAEGIALLFVEPLAPKKRARKRAPKRTPKAKDAARTIHRVRQEFRTSCGVAVVAMFARVSHDEAMRVMFPRKRRVFYTHYTDVIRALDKFGIAHGARTHRFRRWEDIPSTSLVKVRAKDSDGKVLRHWVIYQKRDDGSWNVIDPDPGRGGTQRLETPELRQYVGMTYLTVAPIPPR